MTSVNRTLLTTLLAAVIVGAPLAASAQVAEASLSILGLDAEIAQALVRFEDRNQGVLLQIREIQTGKVKKSWFVENRNDERKRVKRLRRKRFPVEANVEQVDPKGRFTVIGAPDGHRAYDIMVLRDGRVGVLGKVPLKKRDDGTLAKAMLKEVVWSPDGKQVLVVVNQKIEREGGLEDVDDLHWFRFRKWKVKWLKPPGDGAESGESAPQ